MKSKLRKSKLRKSKLRKSKLRKSKLRKSKLRKSKLRKSKLRKSKFRKSIKNKLNKDGGGIFSKKTETEDIIDILKSKITNYDELVTKLWSNYSLKEKFLYSQISMEQKLLLYIRDYIPKQMHFHIYNITGAFSQKNDSRLSKNYENLVTYLLN